MKIQEPIIPKTRKINVAMIGQGFMGKAHSNAWSQVGKFFNTSLQPVLHPICGCDSKKLKQFAANWGYLHSTTNWKKLCSSDQIDLVDIGTPNHLHAPMAMAALSAGKAVACEKPLAGTLQDARKMVQAAARAKAPTFIWYNYRRCPAVALAHKLVRKEQQDLL